MNELITAIANKAFDDLTTNFDINEPENEDKAKRKLEYWLMRLVIQGGSS